MDLRDILNNLYHNFINRRSLLGKKIKAHVTKSWDVCSSAFLNFYYRSRVEGLDNLHL